MKELNEQVKDKQASMVVIIDQNGYVLAVSRKDNHNDFGLPGGKVDPEDPTSEHAGIREVKEETGLDVTNLIPILTIPKESRSGGIRICHTFLALDVRGKIYTKEPHVVKWTTFDTLIQGSFGDYNKIVQDSLDKMGISFLKEEPKK